MSRAEDHDSIRKVLEAAETIKNYCAAGECEGCMFSRPSPLFGDDILHCHLIDDNTIPSHWELQGIGDTRKRVKTNLRHPRLSEKNT